MQTQDITVIRLFIGLLLVLIPAAILWYYKTKIVSDLFIAVIRMVIQLFLVGLYLKYLFIWNSMWINLLWLVLMTVVCCIDLLNRVHISLKSLFGPTFIAIFIARSFIVVYFLKFVLNLDNIFEGQYFIPISGIVLGNILSSNVIGFSAFYDGIVREQQMYNYLICNGATVSEATRPFMRKALIKAFNPTIANIGVMGLISFPGTLIGQLLGGSKPDVAIRYQIMIPIINMAGSVIALWLSLLWSVKCSFDEYGRFKMDLLKKKNKIN